MVSLPAGRPGVGTFCKESAKLSNIMTPEQQRIAIAEACGWKWLDHPDTLDRTKNFQLQGKWVLSPDDQLEFPHDAPDYLNDLNAMKDAMEYVESGAVFTLMLGDITLGHRLERDLGPPESDLCLGEAYGCINATAAQRAEAFLKTLNLYK